MSAPEISNSSFSKHSLLSMPLVKYVLMAALRDRLILSLFILIVVGSCISIVLGTAGVVEKEDFAVAFAAGGLRLAGVLGLVLFVVFHIRRSFETKDVDYLLSRPITRAEFVLSHALAFSLLALVFAFMTSLAVYAINPVEFTRGYALWFFSIAVEFIIMANAALFFSMVLTSPAGGALATLGFYVLARMIGQLLGILYLGADGALMKIMHTTMQGISFIIPRLDLMGQTSWLVYGASDISVLFIIVQGVLFTGLLISAALVDLIRRQF